MINDLIMTGITILVGAVSVIVTLLLSNRTRLRQHQTRNLIQEITGLFAASQKVGIVTAYENREMALLKSNGQSDGAITQEYHQSFVSRLETERKMIVVGSSLLGLRMYVNHLPEIIAGRILAHLETKFIMTHPCFSGFRESQEERSSGQIAKEIDNMVSTLMGFGLKLEKSLRFYKGTPTCFAVITSEAMLLNPYPYQIEAFQSFCIEVRRLPQNITKMMQSKGQELCIPPQIDPKYRKDFEQLMNSPEEAAYDYRLNVGPDIYGQFYWYHYLLPWFSREIVTYDEYCEHCVNCPCLENGFSESICKLHQNEKEMIEKK
ncbi:MAG: hypothetical protein OEV87_01760 [Phycisphaerae bacterium]|nr:hypothetical protein [Phycisphaerae bacterium]